MTAPPAANPRRLAAKVIDRVLHEGAYSNLALDKALAGEPLDPRDAALATELVYGTLTWMRRLDEILSFGVRGAWRKVNPQVKIVLRVALYQIIHLRVPDHAAVHEAAQAARRLKQGPGVVRFVNGVLRGLLRSRERWPQPPALSEDPVGHLASAWSLEPWMATMLLAELGPERACQVAEAFTRRPGLHLRAPDSEARDALVEQLGGRALALSPVGLEAPGMSAALRQALAQGRAAVQDEAAQLVGLLAAPAPGMRVLDACAGLGGKSAHLAGMLGGQGELVAVDLFAHKLEKLRQSFALQGLPAPTTVEGDLRDLDAQALGGVFDRVVVDAPCSGLGVLRRHPEARVTRQPEDLDSLAQLQGELLDAAAALVAPGGALIYSVCTFTRVEGTGQVERWLGENPGWALAPGPEGVPWGEMSEDGRPLWRSWPDEHGCDGFVMARLERRVE